MQRLQRQDMKNEVPEANGSESTPLFEHIEAGIYRYTPNGNYYERATINRKRTWRSLKTKNLKFARKRLHQRWAEISRGAAQQPTSF
jgi:hypothetical protein